MALALGSERNTESKLDAEESGLLSIMGLMIISYGKVLFRLGGCYENMRNVFGSLERHQL
jgi:hypothetical protein